MHKITIRAQVRVTDSSSQAGVTDARRLAKLHGASVRDADLAEWIGDAELKRVELDGGTLRLEFDKAAGSLSVVTEYESPRALTDTEIKKLISYTLGQWSDGAGEGEFDKAVSNNLEIQLDSIDRQSVTHGQLELSSNRPKRKKKPVQIFEGIEKKNAELVRQGLDAGEDPNGQQEKLFPLATACSRGFREAVLILLEAGADVNARGQFNDTALYKCAVSHATSDDEATELARLLLERGADVKPAVKYSEHTALQIAEQFPKPKLAALLRAHS